MSVLGCSDLIRLRRPATFALRMLPSLNAGSDYHFHANTVFECCVCNHCFGQLNSAPLYGYPYYLLYAVQAQQFVGWYDTYAALTRTFILG